jgi:hypothetical protein
MMGHTHALSGLAAGAATLPLIGLSTPLEQLTWVAAWGGFAMLPDLDQRSSTIARMWGPVSAVPAGLIGSLAGGHRHGTHDPIAGPVAFAALAALAARHPFSRAFLLALAIGLALRACAFAIPGRAEESALGNLVLSWSAAWALVAHGHEPARWLPIAVAGGCLVHIAGDALTHHGVPAPLATLIGSRRRIGVPLLSTGSLVETVAVATVFAALTGWQLAAKTGAGGYLQAALGAIGDTWATGQVRV